MKKREEREIQLYHIIKRINKDIEFYSDRGEIIYQAIKNNCTTTQLNHIFIELKVEYERYRGIE